MSSRAGIVESIIKPLIEDHFKTNSNNLVGVEIGVDKGHMSNETMKVLDPSLFYMIDPWDTVVSRKNGFREVILGLSGGIDSALVAALLVDALGSGNVKSFFYKISK